MGCFVFSRDFRRFEIRSGIESIDGFEEVGNVPGSKVGKLQCPRSLDGSFNCCSMQKRVEFISFRK